ncbi:hypothetical protein [Streptomyces sp. NPDC056405]|uniref:hypothetical protein n=1 Tax=Streptomyces sp. NPDC056405 TaxID=3345811 RepID=UPI0035D93FBC
MPPLSITAPDEPIGTPQPQPTAGDATEKERADEKGQITFQKATRRTTLTPPR